MYAEKTLTKGVVTESEHNRGRAPTTVLITCPPMRLHVPTGGNVTIAALPVTGRYVARERSPRKRNCPIHNEVTVISHGLTRRRNRGEASGTAL